MTNNKEQAELLYNQAKECDFYGDNALKYLDAAISLDPSDFKYFMGRGIAKMSTNLISATSDFELTIKLNPTYAEAYFMRGRVKFKSEQNEAAFVDFTRAIELYPHDYRYFENRGEARFILKDYEGAIKDYTDALHIIETDRKQSYRGTNAYIYRGKAKAAIKDYNGAFDDLNKSIEISETSTAYCERSNIKIEIGDFHGGYLDFVKGLSWDENESVTIQFYEKGLSKISAAELIKAVLYCYTEAGNWSIENASQLAIDIVCYRRSKEYHQLAKDRMEIGDYLAAKGLLNQALELMPKKYNSFEVKADIEKVIKELKLDVNPRK